MARHGGGEGDDGGRLSFRRRGFRRHRRLLERRRVLRLRQVPPERPWWASGCGGRQPQGGGSQLPEPQGGLLPVLSVLREHRRGPRARLWCVVGDEETTRR